ncbi:hypothetical protein QCA50_019407 [Cerrena zonata]|uniref:Uncharacterized protein n=1 Tax=Cerrena zonata TaxID=2478898 RepID=A0AAW0FJT6_9APHY
MLGPTIKHLVLQVLGIHHKALLPSSYDSFLKHFTALQTLHVGQLSKTEGLLPIYYNEIIIPVVDALVANLDVLVLGLKWNSFRTLYWKRLDKVLTRPQLSSLRELDVHVDRSENTEDTRWYLEKQLPQIEINAWP